MNRSVQISCFLGATAAEGFTSQFKNVFGTNINRRVYILKGGPGTGKSTILKKLAKTAAERNLDCITAYCSADCNSADAIILPQKSIMVADGTAPHAMAPQNHII